MEVLSPAIKTECMMPSTLFNHKGVEHTLLSCIWMSLAGTRAACINAASIALADAGIPMRDLVVSCAAGFLNSTPLLGISASHILQH